MKEHTQLLKNTSLFDKTTDKLQNICIEPIFNILFIKQKLTI